MYNHKTRCKLHSYAYSSYIRNYKTKSTYKSNISKANKIQIDHIKLMWHVILFCLSKIANAGFIVKI